MRLVRFYRIFSHYLINGKVFDKILLNIKCVFWFCPRLLSKIFLTIRRNNQDIIKKVYLFSSKVPISHVRFKETWIFTTHSRKILKYKILWKSVLWELNCSIRTDGRTEGHKEANGLFFFKFVNEPKTNRKKRSTFKRPSQNYPATYALPHSTATIATVPCF